MFEHTGHEVSESKLFPAALLPMKTWCFVGPGPQASLIALAAPPADCFLLLFFPGAFGPFSAT